MFYAQYHYINEKINLKQQTRRKKFTQQEDEMLRYLTKQFGTLNWNKISQFMPSRNAKQCRDRYCNYLQEVTKDEPWTKEEDEVILNLLSIFGLKWVEISHYIPGRSGINVKNRWYKHLKKHFFYIKPDQSFKDTDISNKQEYEPENDRLYDIKNELTEKIEINHLNAKNYQTNDEMNTDQTYQKYSISSLLI